MHRLIAIGLVYALTSAGCGGDSPPAPSPTVTSVTVAPATPGQAIFIGQRVQFRATSTLSNGQMQTASATWGSNNPGVATVDQSGMVTAIAAGEATIFADVNPRGETLIRVFPNFGGSWAGNEVLASCEDSGDLVGFCDPEFFVVGDVFPHHSMFTQNGASVDAVIDLGDGESATMTGTVTVGGQLELPTAPILPADPLFNSQVQNWRSRADVPSQMTGQYDGFITIPGFPGFARLTFRLEDVVKTTATAGALSRTGGSVGARIRGVVADLERRRQR